MKRYFHNELEELRSKLILIGEKSIEAGRLAVDGFLQSDLDSVEGALKLDDEIDALEVAIDRASVRYITLRAPVSSDVRLIFVSIKASHDFERAGDEAHSIAKKAQSILLRDGRVTEPVNIETMAKLALDLMRDAITCFVEEDEVMAEAIIRRDREIDRLNKENFQTLSDAQDSPGREISGSSGQTKVETILISKSIERIADHAKNLAEEVIYLLRGS